MKPGDLPEIIDYMQKMMRELPSDLARGYARRSIAFYATGLPAKDVESIRVATLDQYRKTHRAPA